MNSQEETVKAERGQPWKIVQDREVGPVDGVRQGSVQVWQIGIWWSTRRLVSKPLRKVLFTEFLGKATLINLVQHGREGFS